jgi:hypothetical protein
MSRWGTSLFKKISKLRLRDIAAKLTNNENEHASVTNIRVLRKDTHKIASSHRCAARDDEHASLLEPVGKVHLGGERYGSEDINRNGHVVDFEGSETIKVSVTDSAFADIDDLPEALNDRWEEYPEAIDGH